MSSAGGDDGSRCLVYPSKFVQCHVDVLTGFALRSTVLPRNGSRLSKLAPDQDAGLSFAKPLARHLA